MKTAGKLYLIPTWLNAGNTQYIGSWVKEVVVNTQHFVVETPKVARAFIKACGYSNISLAMLQELNEHTPHTALNQLLAPLLAGNNVCLMSDAGMPAIADPGARLIKLAHHHQISVIPLSGSSSITLALMASGFNGQGFKFLGYLPKEKTLRLAKLRQMELLANKHLETQIFIETPYRNIQLVEDIISVCNPHTQVCIAYNLESPTQLIVSCTVEELKKKKLPSEKMPAIFLIGSNNS
ncbi:MAG: hypothetical protein RIQ89_1101 [Bacteroidota bacterium]|jgi:16S rRNA (cytidine1402-2'-O)-methyltransferase